MDTDTDFKVNPRYDDIHGNFNWMSKLHPFFLS